MKFDLDKAGNDLRVRQLNQQDIDNVAVKAKRKAEKRAKDAELNSAFIHKIMAFITKATILIIAAWFSYAFGVWEWLCNIV